ncbi:hypothetical protein [Gemmatimonas sp.]|uniref:hypothetical protein n=1 Tax=Gemmatimonas sp. TaxID=1962908 RepID=UPI00286CDFD1|nr:hypothetical protein [Gemmatimonas sp.]
MMPPEYAFPGLLPDKKGHGYPMSHKLLMDRLLAGVDTLRVQYGATASPVAYTIREARRGWGERAAPWPDIARDVVPILGPPLSELLT